MPCFRAQNRDRSSGWRIHENEKTLLKAILIAEVIHAANPRGLSPDDPGSRKR